MYVCMCMLMIILINVINDFDIFNVLIKMYFSDPLLF